jgi:F-type H+/Na+-transporting ATPase subunit alpha
MEIKSNDLVSLIEKALEGAPQSNLDETGVVIQVGDNICRLIGLTNAIYGEVIEFEGGNKGIILDLGLDVVSAFLLYNNIPVIEGEIAKRTGHAFQTPVGMNLLGRVINSLGKPIDALGEIKEDEFRSVEANAPGVIERLPVNEPLETGLMVIDALIPIGKGQRELIIGNRNTGKTTIATDIILHQKGKKVFCIYVSISQKQASLARMVRLLEQNGSMEYTVIVSADAGDSSIAQYLAPYVGCTIGEYFRDKGYDALIIYDDLTNHAVAYREMSLLLRRPPGREAYPGDIFYLHSRLLERAGKVLNGASLTALPMAQVQSDDITAYIPTNLISITDGQIFLDTKLFNEGIRPAVNVELSVSRVGGAAQTKAIKQVTRALRLELAQYHDLLSFAQFGTELDETSQQRLARGAIVVELFKQPEHVTYSFVDETLMLFIFKEGFLNNIDLKKVNRFALEFVSYTKSVYENVYNSILIEKAISDDIRNKLLEIANEFSKIFA